MRPAPVAPSRAHERRPRRSIQRRSISAAPPSAPRLHVGQPRRRLLAALVALVTVLAVLVLKVGQLQTAGGAELRAAGAEQWTRTVALPADRGSIFDRNGEELAVSIPAAAISINPKLIVDAEGTLQTLTVLLALTPDKQAELREEMALKTKGFVYVQREVDEAIGAQLEALGLVGVNVDREDRRILPGGDTGRSVIGLTDIDGLGIAGLEHQFGGGSAANDEGYADILSGAPGEMTKDIAPRGRSIPGSEQTTSAPTPGNDIVLTIDRSIQFATEQALVQRVGELGAKSGYVIVMETHTGNVLAMASVQRSAESGEVAVTAANYAALNAYEPGSVAKVVTIAAGLNQGSVRPDSTFVVPWRRKYADHLLKDSHQHPDELMTVEQILVESSNIGTIDVQISLGGGDWDLARQTHWEYLRRFGFGERTALDYPGESPGILKHWSDLWGSERVTVAYGQGFASTPIQMASAINTIANDGVYVAPRLVHGFVDDRGALTDAPPSETREVVTRPVAETVQAMMRQVTCRGTGKAAQDTVEHFSVAGKTGTGLKAQPGGGYTDASGNLVYYASFAGFFPAEDPQVTVLVSIDEPPAGDINRFGGTAAAPVFAGLVPVIAHELGLQPPPNTTPCG